MLHVRVCPICIGRLTPVARGRLLVETIHALIRFDESYSVGPDILGVSLATSIKNSPCYRNIRWGWNPINRERNRLHTGDAVYSLRTIRKDQRRLSPGEGSHSQLHQIVSHWSMWHELRLRKKREGWEFETAWWKGSNVVWVDGLLNLLGCWCICWIVSLEVRLWVAKLSFCSLIWR